MEEFEWYMIICPYFRL